MNTFDVKKVKRLAPTRRSKGNIMKRSRFFSRKNRIRKKLRATNPTALRLSVFRSNRHIAVQIIDDTKSKTLVSASDYDLTKKGTPSEVAKEVGKLLAERAKKAKIERVVFDRGGYAYHGRVKALVESARENNLKI